MNSGIIILAAGESKRMGTPKQVLAYNGTTFLLNTIENALASKFFPITVVVGAFKNIVAPSLSGLPINIIDNAAYKDGIGTSIRMGLIGSYMITKDLDAVIITTVNQPEVTLTVWNELYKAALKSEKEIINFDLTVQNFPVLVKRSLFEKLLDLDNDTSFEDFCAKNGEKVLTLKSNLELKSINTKEDYLNIVNPI